jgi:CheY-like chemotaxis protein
MTAPGPLCILVVEDEALIMMATVDALCELGYDVLRARNAEAALAHLDAGGPIGAMLTDVNLPDMDGQTLAAEVRRRRPNLPVIFATGYSMKVGAMADDGPTAVLSKPYLQSDLHGALKRVLPAPG